jgi:glycosyltransferase involved in cell wall biosynthesis
MNIINKKIIILTDDFPPKSGGGAAVIAGIHAKALVSQGFEVLVITSVENKKDIGEFNENGIRVIRLYSKYNPRWRSWLSLYNPFILPKLKDILKKEQADIIHTHNIHYHFSYASLKIAKKYSKALFHTVHDSMPFHYSKLFPKYPYDAEIRSYKTSTLRQLKDFKFRFNPFRKIIIQHYLFLPNKIFAVSNALKKALTDNSITNVEVINNGIDIEKWKRDESGIEEFKRRFGLIDKKVILFCGRLSRAKGGDVLIKMMSRILEEIPSAVLLIVGDKSSEVTGDGKYLIFTGKLSGNDLINAYGASKVLAVPSLCFDWFPTVNLEAMAMKLPVVATCFGGSKELILDGKSGYIINPYHDSEIIEKIVNILKDNTHANLLGEAGYNRVLSNFSIKNYIQNTINWYNKFSI